MAKSYPFYLLEGKEDFCVKHGLSVKIPCVPCFSTMSGIRELCSVGAGQLVYGRRVRVQAGGGRERLDGDKFVNWYRHFGEGKLLGECTVSVIV